MDTITKTFVDGSTVIDASFLNDLISKLNVLITSYNSGSGGSTSTLGNVNIAFNTSTSNATLSADNSTAIYYTTDGKTPTTSSSQYSSAIALSSGDKLTAIATNGTDTTSVPAVTATYDADAQTIALSATSGTITYSKDGGSATAYSEALDASSAATYTIYLNGTATTTITITA